MHDDDESRKEKCATMREMGELNWQEREERWSARETGELNWQERKERCT